MNELKFPAEKACEEAKTKLEKLGIEEKIQAELAWVIGSYNYDKNPEGLYEIGNKALTALVDFKSQKPRLVSKKFIADLEKSLSQN
ncbi:MAG: hypothetical protein RJQ09_03555 [Cyclobacteriaceae bacterium]